VLSDDTYRLPSLKFDNMKNLDNPNSDDGSNNGDESKANGTMKLAESVLASKTLGHLYNRKCADAVLIHLNELRNLRAVAKDNDIIHLPGVSWIPHFDQDLARMYGGNPTATKTDDKTTYMWIQDLALMKHYQEWHPRAYVLIVDKDLITQLTERAEKWYKAKSTGWFQPMLKTGKPKEVAEYSESEREAYEKFKAHERFKAHENFKAQQKSPSVADRGGGEHMPTLKSCMEEWRRRDLASTGLNYVQICESGHSGYVAALAHRWINMAAVVDTESRMRRRAGVESEAFEMAVRRLDSLWIQYK
jgi:hypothetical protein